MGRMLDTALAYLDSGVSVIPIDRGTKKPPTRMRWKPYQAKLPDRATATRWFGTDGYNLACIMGPVSGGLASRDFDIAESYHSWAGNFPALARSLPTVETQRGFHVYFRTAATTDTVIKNADGELRLSGCYNLAPASVHPSGKQYVWRIPFTRDLPTIDDFVANGLIHDVCNRENRDYSRHCALRGDEQETFEEDVFESTSTVQLPLTHSCPQYSLDTLLSLLHQEIGLAIARTTPSGAGRRHKQLFEFSRELKALPEIATCDIRMLKPLVRRWHAAALPYIRSKPFEETWLDFAEGWNKVKSPKGKEPIREMFEAAKCQIPAVAQQYESQDVRHLVALCRVLQLAAGDAPFFLAARTAGSLFGVSHVQASRWLRILCLDQILLPVEQGSMKAGKATRYRYLADLKVPASI